MLSRRRRAQQQAPQDAGPVDINSQLDPLRQRDAAIAEQLRQAYGPRQSRGFFNSLFAR